MYIHVYMHIYTYTVFVLNCFFRFHQHSPDDAQWGRPQHSCFCRCCCCQVNTCLVNPEELRLKAYKHRGSQRLTEAHRGSQRLTEVHRATEAHGDPQARRGSQRIAEAHRGPQRLTEVHSSSNSSSGSSSRSSRSGLEERGPNIACFAPAAVTQQGSPGAARRKILAPTGEGQIRRHQGGLALGSPFVSRELSTIFQALLDAGEKPACQLLGT